jgi:hypothetical protein
VWDIAEGDWILEAVMSSMDYTVSGVIAEWVIRG